MKKNIKIKKKADKKPKNKMGRPPKVKPIVNNRSNAGRKWFDGKNEDAVITKLTQVWAIGGTDAEAAYYADISTASISRYLDSHPDISEQKNRLKNKPILKARREVIKGLNKNPDFSLKYLERKLSNEFAPSHRVGIEGTENNKPVFITYVPTKRNRNH